MTKAKTYSATELYVVAHYAKYSDVSVDFDTLYTTKEAAEAAASELDRGYREYSTTPVQEGCGYSVYTLDDAISEVKSQAWADGMSAASGD